MGTGVTPVVINFQQCAKPDFYSYLKYLRRTTMVQQTNQRYFLNAIQILN